MIAGMYKGFFFSVRGRVSQMQDLLVKHISYFSEMLNDLEHFIDVNMS